MPLGLTFLIMHEMDAVRQKEWRIIPAWRNLSDETGYIIFLLIHIPMFLPLFLIPGSSETVFFWLDIFLMAHAGIHFVLRNNPHIDFRHWYSWLCIEGAAVMGAIHLGLMYLG
ncbi:MAG: DUF6713 family protein [Bacteroidota bacterium]